MARIRTIKPEFWTDEKVVQLPYEARLLFIGLWNFADDEGLLKHEPDRIKMQIFPSDDIDVWGFLDLLDAIGVISILYTEDCDELIQINGFQDHQKISHKTPSKIAPENYRKKSIPLAVRRAVAKKYGCEPGCSCNAECYFCGSPGQINWQKLSSGAPGSWVHFSRLELDHFESEANGGETTENNIVLSCRDCNRSKGQKSADEWMDANFWKTPECSGKIPLERKGKEGKGNGKEEEETISSASAAPPTEQSVPVMEFPVAHKKIKSWALTQDLIDELAQAFPGVDVPQQCRQALVWVKANPSKKKTPQGMSAFLTNWMSRQQNRGSPSGASRGGNQNQFIPRDPV